MWNIDEFLSGLNIDLDRLRDVFTYDPQAPMIFSSGIFLWLFVAFILVYLLLQRRTTARLLFVTLFSYYFYYQLHPPRKAHPSFSGRKAERKEPDAE